MKRDENPILIGEQIIISKFSPFTLGNKHKNKNSFLYIIKDGIDFINIKIHGEAEDSLEASKHHLQSNKQIIKKNPPQHNQTLPNRTSKSTSD